MIEMVGNRYWGREVKEIVKRGKNYLLCRCSNGKYIVFEKKGEWIPIYLDEYEEVIIKWGAIIH